MKDIKLKDIVEYNFFSSLEISQDQNYLAFIKTKGNYEKDKYDSDLCLYDIKNENLYQLTDDGKAGLFASYNDKIIYKKDSTDDKDILYTKDIFGKSDLFLSIDKNVNSIKHLKDDKFLLSVSSKKTKEEIEKEKEDSYYQKIDSLAFYFNGEGFIKNEDLSLYLYDKKTDDLTLIKEFKKDEVINNFDLDENLENLIYLKSNFTDQKVNTLKEDIILYNIEEKKETIISKEVYSCYCVKFIKDKIIFVATDMKKGGINEDCFIYTSDFNGHIEKITGDDFDLSFGNSIGTDARYGSGKTFAIKNDKLYFIATNYEKSQLYSIDLGGKLEVVIDSNVEDFALADDEIYYFKSGIDHLPSLNKKSSDKDLIETEKFDVCKIEKFDFKSNGDELTGFVILPDDFDKDKKYPTILSVHGGPKTEFSDIFHHEHQMLAKSGYIIIYTNPHGSSGRGVKFSDIRGRYGEIDFDDLMNFTDLAIEKYPQIDTEKMAIYGGSYGGFMTNWAIGHTDRFKAAVSQRSISNWTSFFGVSDIGYYFATDQTGGDIWDNFDKIWDLSPIKYANMAKTPTLFIHSDEDYRCPLEQGLQMYTKLKLNEVDTKMYIFHKENHELSRSGKPKARIKRLEAIKEWLDKYLG